MCLNCLELVGVSADNGKDKLTLTFRCDAQIRSGRRQGDAPPLIEAIDSELEQAAVVVRFSFGGKVDANLPRGQQLRRRHHSPDARAARARLGAPDELGELEASLSRKPVAAGADPPQTVPSRQAPARTAARTTRPRRRSAGAGAACAPTKPADASPRPRPATGRAGGRANC
jgi:hypothetical protein